MVQPRSLRSALEVASRPLLFDGRRLNVERHCCRKKDRHSHFLTPRFLARALLGNTLLKHVLRRQQTSRVPGTCTTSAIVRFPIGRRNFTGISSQRSELLLCSFSPLGKTHTSSISHQFRTTQVVWGLTKRNEKRKPRYQDPYF